MQEVTDLPIAEEDVIEALSKIREGSAPGPEGISTKLILGLKDELVKPLTIFFRKSISESRIPDEWRDAVVTLIFKKGTKTDPGNNRPVSLTSVFCKTLERIVKKQVVKHVEDNG